MCKGGRREGRREGRRKGGGREGGRREGGGGMRDQNSLNLHVMSSILLVSSEGVQIDLDTTTP